MECKYRRMKFVMKFVKKIFFVLLILNSFLFSEYTASASDNYTTICNLNLFRFGEKGVKSQSKDFLNQKRYLVSRIRDANCDLVGLQEVVGEKKKRSYEILGHLVESLNSPESNSSDMPRSFKIVLGDSNDSRNRNAIIYDSSLFELSRVKSWNRQSLPKLDIRSVPWSHTRGPLSVVLSHRAFPDQKFLLINYHLKSKASGWKDPLGTKFEFQRMLAASGVREIAESESNASKDKTIVVMMGDRNSNNSGAASEVLSGRLQLQDFSKTGSCEISPEGTALCPAEVFREPDMIPLLQRRGSLTGEKIATYRRGRRFEILDEIYIRSEDVVLVNDKNGIPQSGTAGEFMKGSDHLLSYVRVVLKR